VRRSDCKLFTDYCSLFTPSFEYHICDLSQISDEELRGAVILRVSLLLLKYVTRDDLRANLVRIFQLLKELSEQRTGLEYLETALRYIARTASTITADDLRETVVVVLDEGDNELMETIAETWKAEGHAEGRAEGAREGILESIEIVLELKFGANGLLLLPEIEQIDNIDLLRVVHKSLRTADSPADVRRIYQTPGE